MRVLVLLSLVATPASASLINPGFEPDAPVGSNNILPGGSFAIPGWETILDGAEWFNAAPFGASPDGGYAVDLANFTFSTGGVRQSFATVAGETYTVEFSLGTSQASGRSGFAEVVVDADGTMETFTLNATGTVNTWESRTFTFVADDSEATLTFSNFQDGNAHFAFIDGVSVVPAPSGVGLAGAAAFGLIGRRRR